MLFILCILLLPVVVLYERFCNRMESMMDNAPQFNLISFMGP